MTFGIDLRDLRYFEAIAELEHLGKASERLHRTQPALTSAVRRLEEVCGAPLFMRNGRGIQLSPAGHVLLKWARRMRFDADDAEREIKDVVRGLQGEIRIGIVPTAAQYILPAAVNRLLQDAPELKIKTRVGLVDTMAPLLRDGALDLLVGTEAVNATEFASRVLVEDVIVVAACKTHPIFSQPANLQSLTRFRWILQPAGAPTRDWLDRTFNANGLPSPEVQIEANMLLILPALIAKAGLLSFISRHHLLTNTDLREVALEGATMKRRIAVAYTKDRYVAPAVWRLMDALEQSAKGDTTWAE